VALVSAYALLTRLFPNGFLSTNSLTGVRLSSPVGYWNGLGLVAGMGAVLAVALSARSMTAIGRAAAGAAVPVLLATLYFTFSRGAWISTLAALAVLVVCDRCRLQLAATGVPIAAIAGIVVWRASRADALTHVGATLAAATHDGHRLAAVLVAAMAASAYAAVLARQLERVISPPRRMRIAAGAVAVALVMAVLAGAFVRFGSPVSLAHRAYHSFTRSAPSGGANLNNRLFSLANNGRIVAWKTAWHAFEAHPILGVGAGGFEQVWNEHRTVGMHIRDAHSLYIETLAETGIIGLGLLVVALAAPLVGFWRARKEPLAAAALAAYVAFLVEAAVDWDWELSGVTLVALLCGGAVLVAGRERGSRRRRRLPPLVLGSLLGVAALAGLGGNLLLALSSKAATAGNWSAAASDARRAELWAPWSAQPWQQLGAVQLASGQRSQALASFRTAVRKDSGDWTLWVGLARAATGKERAAAFARAHALNPLDPTIAQTESEVGSS
jgi:hypothetical protein